MSLFELLELLLLFLFNLQPSAVFRILLLNLLLLLDLLLLDALALPVLLQAELFQLLLMLLIELRVHSRARAAVVGPGGWRTVVIRLISAIVCRWITGLITLRRWAGVVVSRRLVRIALHIGLRLSRVVGTWRPIRIILNVRLLLPRTIAAVVLYRAGPVGLDALRHVGIGGWCDLDVRTGLLRVLGLHLTHLRDGWRPAAIGLNGLLLLYEGYGSRRR